ncbi:uncharacterized protein LOC124277078 [Haliotis rubra]|uniref:uncharacterized protein LOC124277078 n=1 Tax=Haliotis rubra TaxID=36100 RepID=UPI001EE62CD2|nr:uncharacterized protein LOC124277078 [Haliotis rubra]
MRYTMVLRWNLFSMVLAFEVHGWPLELTLAANSSLLTNLTSYGVDISRCRSIKFQVKACEDHGFTITNSSGSGLMDVTIGGWSNTRSYLEGIGASAFPSTDGILSCDEYRSFWIDWNDQNFALGKGEVVGEEKVAEVQFPQSEEAAHMFLKRVNGTLPSNRIGEMFRSQFELVTGRGRFSDGLIEEKATTFVDCIDLCTDHRHCGMFSYNSELTLCVVFDRMASSFSMTSENGWKSWKMRYCNM